MGRGDRDDTGEGGKRVHQTWPADGSIETFSRTGSADGGLCLGGVWGSDSLLPKDPKTHCVDQIPVLIADWIELGLHLDSRLSGRGRQLHSPLSPRTRTVPVSLLGCASFSRQ
ncbi:hypothetical protein EMPG_14264 [Blastomyces silverae]|uniref:Uncharacterized protein n=1 Tax=Blastomyces silverae TaxID=2060906 RepID=A0A0H1BGA0_9EURO|nr:hypothetical protein EMPG_14264 [Blastomyces silverae]